MTDSSVRRFATLAVAALVAAWLTAPGAASAQTQFESPDAAARALVDAAAAADLDRVVEILGPEYRDRLVPDRAEALDSLAELAASAAEAMAVEVDGDQAEISLGRQDWPFPILVVQGAEGWAFDTADGIEEIIDRRVGANELAAIEVCRAFLDAQVAYAAADRDADDVLEFAQRIRSTPGMKDGLYWEAAPGEEESPFGPLVAENADYLEGRAEGAPYHGYYFRVLTRQENGVPGGRYDYVINGNMIAGFGLIATPAVHGDTGIMTFQCNHRGRVSQRDLGENTDTLAAAFQAFDVDEGWTVVEPD